MPVFLAPRDNTENIPHSYSARSSCPSFNRRLYPLLSGKQKFTEISPTPKRA
ncbi:hypothetical protein Z948_2749 [Sulfitobacter donghicola DSW-25 = KCTC 12864 = JCM 14565]|nr:hypothetical protein Z948_2749 [Sulfitobacter donghicola DSW-25 = KCTC 12864 = JCM 14565]